jgi:hypothetical protein
MKSANLVSETVRQSESGLCWEEKISNSTGTVKVPKHATVRVRCVTTGATVTIDGVLAATMIAGEVIVFNAGDGDPDNTGTAANTVSVVIAAQACFIQVAREAKRPKLAV